MSTDGMSHDIDKLAAEIKKMRPSKTSKTRGIEAAMAAFDAEFAAEALAPDVPANENNSDISQGLDTEPRPTSQTRKTSVTRVETQRSGPMSTIKSIFNMSPKTAMMGSGCVAALLAALVIMPANPMKDMPSVQTQPVAVVEPLPVPSTATVEPKVTPPTPAAELLGKVREEEAAGNEAAMPRVEADMSQPTDATKTRAEQREREAKLNARKNQQSALLASPSLQAAPPQIQRQSAGKVQFGMPAPAPQMPSADTPVNSNGYILEEVPAEYKTETKIIVTKEATTEYVSLPPVYETIMEPVVIQEASTELVTIPPTYNPDGSVKTPAQTRERVIPPVTKMETRRVVKTPAATQERIVPAGTTKKVSVRTEIAPQRFYLRDERGTIIREFESRDAFEIYQLNTTTSASETPVSTFSVDVDTASYAFIRSSLNRGQLPPRGSVRLEEMINYFPYDYTAPRSADTPFNANVTVSQSPWNSDTKLMHIGIKGYVPSVDERPRSNIVFLIDTSGSMNQPNKLPLLISSFKMLLKTLDEDDTVSIVTYAGSAGTVLEPTPATDKRTINAALSNLRAGGSTAGAAGLELAYNKAQESFLKDGNNRVILATDGDFNVGFSSPDEMKTFIEKKRETGIFLSVLGFGSGNYNDHLMQSLAQNGNGIAAYIDSLSEANKVLADEAGSSLLTIAKDVKIQVEFNPATISEYRLIGYETRALKRQDFNNDKVDAGEIGAGHSVTAIYEITPVGSPAGTIDKLRYVSEDAKRTNGSDEYAFVKIRHKLPDADKSTLQTFPVGKGQERRLSRASDDMRFASAVAAFGQKLRGDTQVADYSYDDIIKQANKSKGDDDYGYRAEFVKLVRLAETLTQE